MVQYTTSEAECKGTRNKSAIKGEVEAWNGPYLDSPCPKNFWGRDWIYRNPSEDLGPQRASR